MNKLSLNDKETIVITKEDANFRMDEHGRWINDGGPVEKASIIRYLNSAIEKDENGYYVTHMLGDRREKVYFEYEDTALFVIDLKLNGNDISLLLNTKRRLKLEPAGLFLKDDSLYLEQSGHVIKFNERAMVKMAPFLAENEEGLIVAINGQKQVIREE